MFLCHTQVNCPAKLSEEIKVHMEPSTLEEGDLTGLEVCNFGGTEIALPLELIEKPDIFFTVLSKDTWKNVLTAENRKHLEKFLPALPTDYPHAQENNLSSLFDGDNFHFGNPVVQFQQKLNDGYYYPDVVKYKKLCQKAKYKEYKIQQQRYHRKLLREILISRQEILDQIGRQSPGEPIKTSGHTSSPDSMMIDYKVTRCLKKILTECKEECQDDKWSSDEEERGFGSFGSLGYSLTPFHMFPGVLAGFHPMMGGVSAVPYGFHGFPYPPPVHRLSSSPALAHHIITEDDFRTMIQVHRKRRLANEGHPELDTRFIALQDIISRTNPTKKSSKPTDFTKKKDKKAKVKRRLKQKLQQKQERRVQMKVEQSPGKREEPEKTQLPIPTGKMCCFFSLIRDILNSFPDHKGNLQKVEEYVKAWQVSPSLAISSWSTQEPDWVQLVYSALMFLSGSSGDASSSFVPLVDFKERPQHWKWIGSSRDSDDELEQLCQEWLQIKDQLIIRKDGITELGSSATPAARVKTDFVVRPSTEDERLAFRDQENERYANPHKAFTFRMHGFESVVGPVKGVFSKDTNLNKAREHSLLLSSRPPYVTILTLVRDAAARLPNGEGTRAEVCELLKDSQFLNPNSSDAQIHTVVSGALDRLHYERDPCVKYDSNRKVWIYLHRNRSEEEFEKIHQASAAAARAKKLQKPRVPRQQKTKDSGSSGTQSLPVPNPPQEVDFAAVHLEEEIQPPSITPEETSPKVPVVPCFSPAQQDSSAMKKTSRLNTADLNITASPGGFTSALNTHTSVLSTADYAESSPRQPLVFGSDESRSELQDLRGQDWSSEDESSGRSSGSGNDSDSGSGSSSENELESKDYQGGGKTLPGVDQRLVLGEIHQRQQLQDTGSLDHGNLSPHQSQLTQSEYGSESESDFSNVE